MAGKGSGIKADWPKQRQATRGALPMATVRPPSVRRASSRCSASRLPRELFTLRQPPSGSATESLEGGQELAQAEHGDLLACVLGLALGTSALS